MMKQSLLVPEDKIAIQELYKNLDPLKMWKLSFGAIVEKKMEQFASTCTFEERIDLFSLFFFFSPCHSLIPDSGDKYWETIFTKEDLG